MSELFITLAYPGYKRIPFQTSASFSRLLVFQMQDDIHIR